MKIQRSVLTFSLLFFSNFLLSQASLKGIDLVNGNYKVGFKHYFTDDSTRTYKRLYDWNNKAIPRPISVSIWYPSNEDVEEKEPLNVLDYMEILKIEEEWESLPNEQILNWFYYANTPANQTHLQEKTTSFHALKSAEGKFPVVIYAPSYQASSIENFALCEYLASHGYIVMASPSRGTDNRFFEGGTAKDMETQARDIEFLIKEVAKMPNANLNQLATMGFSFGGLSNVLTQMRNSTIKAIVSLDGSIKYQYASLKKSPYFNLGRVNVPFIHMAQKDIPELVLEEENLDPALNTDFEFYDSLTNNRAFQLKFHDLTHSYFSTLGVLFQQRDQRQDKSDPEIMASYKLISMYTLNFLDAFLKNDKDALKFIENSPVDNGIRAGLISQKSKLPKQKTFTFQDFNELAAKQNYQNLTALYASVLEKHPSVELPEWMFNNLGLQLVFNPKTSQDAIHVFLLAVQIYPNSANLFDSLAEAYLLIGDKEKAKENFEKSLDLYPENNNAIEKLKQLEEGK